MNPQAPSLAIITGSSRGIGAALAAELLTRGWQVIGVSRSAPPPELLSHGMHSIELDLADLDALEATFAEQVAPRITDESLNRVALVNNAAMLATASTTRLGARELQRSLTLNTVAPTWLMGWALRHVPPTTPLRLANLSSGAAFNGYPGWSAYCQGKFALRAAGLALALELDEAPEHRDRRASVLSYSPGVVATGMQAEIRASASEDFPRRQRFVDLHEQKQLIAPESVARDLAAQLERRDPPRYEERKFEGS